MTPQHQFDGIIYNMRKIQLAIFILVPLANFVPGLIWGQPFDQNPEVLIQPAGYAFAIWGPIFLGMLIYSVFQLKMERASSPHLRVATYAASSAGLASIAFVPISYLNIQWLTMLDILWHLGSLVVLYRALYRQVRLEMDPQTHWYYLGTQLYLGWISAATAVSIALFLREAGMAYALMTEVYITAGVLVALIAVAAWLTTKGGQGVALTIVWALGGVIVSSGQYMPIYYTAATGMVLLLGLVLYTFVKGDKLYDQNKQPFRLRAI